MEEVPGGFDMTPFYEGEVDVWAGFITDEVIRARQQGLDLVTFPLHAYGIRNEGQLVYAGQAGLEDNPELAVRFLRASLRGWEWAMENPNEAVDIMLTLFPELADQREFHLASFKASIPLIRPSGKRVGAIDCDAFADTVLSADIPTVEGLCTTEIVEMAWQDD